MELSDQVHDRISRLSSEGDDLAEAGKFREAIARYCEALDLLPEPKTNC